MRRISFGLTIQQYRNGTKNVTRRLGWAGQQAGDRLLAVDKVMGFRKGQHATVLGELQVVSVRRERLDAIDQDDVRREGFPHLDPAGFVAMFCKAMGCSPDTLVTRIEFQQLPPPATA